MIQSAEFSDETDPETMALSLIGTLSELVSYISRRYDRAKESS